MKLIPPPLEKISENAVDVHEAARILDVSESRLAYMRREGQGPKWGIDQNRHCMYELSDLEEWRLKFKDYVSVLEAARRINIPNKLLYELLKEDDAPKPKNPGMNSYSFFEIKNWLAKIFNGYTEIRKLYTTADIARHLHISRSAVYFYKIQNKLPPPVLTIRKRMLWDPNDIEKWWQDIHSKRTKQKVENK